MSIRQIAAIIPLICLDGCASNNTEQNFDRALKAHWSKVSESDFPLPATTPYDTDANHRDQYLKGYADGVREKLSECNFPNACLPERSRRQIDPVFARVYNGCRRSKVPPWGYTARRLYTLQKAIYESDAHKAVYLDSPQET